MIFTKLSNTVFRFVLRCAGVEIDGGCSNPPPIMWWKIQRPIRARVKVSPVVLLQRRGAIVAKPRLHLGLPALCVFFSARRIFDERYLKLCIAVF